MSDQVSLLLIDKVFFQIMNMSITAGAVILVVLVVRVLLKRAPKIFSYALWGIVLFRLLCPVSFSSSLSLFHLWNRPNMNSGGMTFVSDEQIHDAAESDRGQDQDGNVTPYLPESVDAVGSAPLNGDTFEGNSSGIDSGIDVDIMTSQNDGSILTILRNIWILGMFALILIHVLRYIRLRRQVSASLRLRENIYLCDDIQTPFCLGVIRPQIYLPSSLEKEEMEYVILHEKHHIKRFDPAIKLLAFIALCIHWPNPLVWTAFVLAGRDMEMSCDEAIVRKSDQDIRTQYSASLLHLATGRKMFTSSTLSFGEGNPKQRIQNIMSYKKPAFWVILLSIAGCIALSITLLSDPPTENPPTEEESILAESEASSEGDESSQNQGLFHPEYERLIRSAEEEAFADSNDPGRELGYLVQDIDGDGIKELMFGANYWSGDVEEHILYNIYTLQDDKAVPVFDGEDVSEAYFIPFGAQWEELADLDGNGQPEYIVYYDSDEEEGLLHNEFVYAFNMENIYRHVDLLYVDVYDTRYLDLDHDGEKEVVIGMFPLVNSMPLIEYAVIKERNGNWEKLEMYQGETILDNTFPVSIVKGEGPFEAKISVAGLDKEIIYSFENRYRYWAESADESTSASYAQSVKNYYDEKILNMEKDSVCATTAAWGIWTMQHGTYQEQDCLIAEQGIQGYDKEDIWGSLFIYFDYDSDGRIRILDIVFVPNEEESSTDAKL